MVPLASAVLQVKANTHCGKNLGIIALLDVQLMEMYAARSCTLFSKGSTQQHSWQHCAVDRTRLQVSLHSYLCNCPVHHPKNVK